MLAAILAVVNAILSIFGKSIDASVDKEKTKVNAAKDISVAQINAEPELYKSRVDLLKGFAITQWLIAGALIPPIYHAGGVYLDSCPFFLIPYFPHLVGSWGFVALPGSYPEMQTTLITSLLGINAGMAVGGSFVKSLLLRK